MKTIIIESSQFHLMQLEYELSEYSQAELVGTFGFAGSALRYAEEHRVDLAFVSFSLPDMSGPELAERLRCLQGGMTIIYISEHPLSSARALTFGTDCLVMSSFRRCDVERVITRAIIMSSRHRKSVFIKTFGNFGVFVDGVPLGFSSRKAKELLAYLVDRCGNVVDTREGFSVLWEDRSFCASSASSYRKVLSRLLLILQEAGISNILRIYSRGRAVNKSAFECDYYSYLAGDRDVIRSWNGEYMTNYSWGESTLGWLHENRTHYYSELR